jgi:hypothetical protein
VTGPQGRPRRQVKNFIGLDILMNQKLTCPAGFEAGVLGNRGIK